MHRIALSPRLLSEPFWDAVCAFDDERAAERTRLAEQLKSLDSLRAEADYNTGSIAFAGAWLLYSLTRHLQPGRIIEVGTFIGRSLIAMAQGLDDSGLPGEIATCDVSNAMEIPWRGATRLDQYPRTTSLDMFKALAGRFDMVFLDGRLQPPDLEPLSGLIDRDTVIGLDDFEGAEKGVYNLMLLSRLDALKGHVLIYPPSQAWLSARGLTSYSLTAVLLPASTFEFTRQG